MIYVIYYFQQVCTEIFNVRPVVYYIIQYFVLMTYCIISAQGADPFEHHHLRTEHAAPFIRFRHHHGIFKF